MFLLLLLFALVEIGSCPERGGECYRRYCEQHEQGDEGLHVSVCVCVLFPLTKYLVASRTAADGSSCKEKKLGELCVYSMQPGR